MSVPSLSSLDTVEGAMERDEVSPRIFNSELEVEEAKEIGGDDRGIDEASLKISTSGLGIEEAKGMDEASPKISNSELEVEEAKDIGRDDRGIDEASLKISTSGLGIEEAKGMDEASPKIGTSTETNFEGMGNERFFDLYCCVLQSNLYRLFSSPSTTETSK
jgi:hypothetical protein